MKTGDAVPLRFVRDLHAWVQREPIAAAALTCAVVASSSPLFLFLRLAAAEMYAAIGMREDTYAS